MLQLSKIFKKPFLVDIDDVSGVSIPNPYVGQIVKTPNQTFKISAIDSSGNLSFVKMTDNVDLQNAYNDLRSQIITEKNRAVGIEGSLANIDDALVNNNLVAAINSAKNYADQIKSEILDGAPEALDTLKELADSMGDLTNLKEYTDTQNNSLHNTIKKEAALNFVSVSDDLSVNSGSFLLVDTNSKSITITLPDSPVDNDVIKLKDIKNNASNNNVIVSGNGNTINGDDNLVVDVDGANIELVFINEWIIV
jgi:hypothetical protein